MRLLVCGLGYSARTYVARFGSAFDSTLSTVREPAEGKLPNVTTGRIDGGGASSDVNAALRGTTPLLVAVPPSETGDPVLNDHAADIASTSSIRSIVYL